MKKGFQNPDFADMRPGDVTERCAACLRLFVFLSFPRDGTDI